VAIEADHLVGAGHHQVQIVGDHQHGAVEFGGELADEGVELDLPRDVYSLDRFVQHQQLGLDQQGAGQQHPLHLAAGELLHPVVQQILGADPAEGLLDGEAAVLAELQEAAHRQRQRGVQVEALRHITDPQIAAANDFARVRIEQAQHQLAQGALSRSVGADQGGDFAFVQGKGDLVEHESSVK